MKTKLEILDEVVNYYNQDPSRRAVIDDFRCEYVTEDGRMCAVGICLLEPDTMPQVDIADERLVEDHITFTHKTMMRFKPEYRINDVKFWQGLQKLHDSKLNWTPEGLSLEGKHEVHLLELKHA
jgi:hypothetical protein